MLKGSLTGNTLLVTDDGLIAAKDLTNSHRLLGKQGFINVKRITHRYLDLDEIVYTITANGSSISVTGNHQLFIYRPVPCSRDKSRPCKPGKYHSREHECWFGTNKCRYGFRSMWIPADNLTIDDYVGMFIVKSGKKDILIDSAKYGSTCSDRRRFRYRNINEERIKVWNYLDRNGAENETRDTLSKKLSINRNVTHSVLSQYRKGVNHSSRYISITGLDLNMFSYMVGQYVGDGSVTGTCIEITHNHTESKEYNAIIKHIVDKIFNTEVHLNIGLECSWERTRFSHTVLSQWFKTEIGNSSYTKKLPAYIWTTPLTTRLSLISGIIDSDGSYSRRPHDGVSICLKNQYLVKQIQSLLATCGIIASYRAKNDGLASVYISNSQCNTFTDYAMKLKKYVRHNQYNSHNMFTHQGMMWRKITNISTVEYTKQVYGVILEKDTHGFVADTIIIR